MPVRWTRPARDDLVEIQDFVAEENPAAASRLINRLIERVETLLSDNPRIGRLGRVDGTRELVISGTRYVAAYRVADQVEIVAVVHAARKWPADFDD